MCVVTKKKQTAPATNFVAHPGGIYEAPGKLKKSILEFDLLMVEWLAHPGLMANDLKFKHIFK